MDITKAAAAAVSAIAVELDYLPGTKAVGTWNAPHRVGHAIVRAFAQAVGHAAEYGVTARELRAALLTVDADTFK